MTPKCLVKVVSVATTEKVLYLTPYATSSILTSIIVCNRGATTSTFRISNNTTSDVTSTSDYLYYDISITGNDTFVAEFNLPLITNNEIRVYSDTNNLTFSVYGKEDKV